MQNLADLAVSLSGKAAASVLNNSLACWNFLCSMSERATLSIASSPGSAVCCRFPKRDSICGGLIGRATGLVIDPSSMGRGCFVTDCPILWAWGTAVSDRPNLKIRRRFGLSLSATSPRDDERTNDARPSRTNRNRRLMRSPTQAWTQKICDTIVTKPNRSAQGWLSASLSLNLTSTFRTGIDSPEVATWERIPPGRRPRSRTAFPRRATETVDQFEV